jgi:hypothetical protein
MRMSHCMQSVYVPAEDIELGRVDTRLALFAASARAPLES